MTTKKTTTIYKPITLDQSGATSDSDVALATAECVLTVVIRCRFDELEEIKNELPSYYTIDSATLELPAKKLKLDWQ